MKLCESQKLQRAQESPHPQELLEHIKPIFTVLTYYLALDQVQLLNPSIQRAWLRLRPAGRQLSALGLASFSSDLMEHPYDQEVSARKQTFQRGHCESML